MIFQKLFKNSLVKNSMVYVICDGINKAIPFLILPFISYYLSTGDYGVVTNFNVLVSILSVFVFSSTGVLPVKFFKLNKDELKIYSSNLVFINSLSILVWLLICILLQNQIESSLGLPVPFLFYALVVAWLSGITYVNMVLWRCEERPLAFGVYQISQSAVNGLTTILFVIILLMGWKGRIYSMMIATALFGVISIWILARRGYLELKINRKYLSEVLFFTLPLIPHAMSFWFRSGVSKILLTDMCDLSENGLYSVALTWTSIVAMFLTAFSNAYSPYLFKKLSLFDKDRNNTLVGQIKIVKLIRWCMLLIVVLVAIAYVVSFLLIRLMYAPSYHASIRFLPWTMLGQLFDGCYLLFVGFAHYTFNTKKLGAITFLLSMLSIVLSWAGILLFGSVGVAISIAFTSFLIFISVAILAMKVYKLPWIYLIRN